jgi:hypothetical protein
MTGSIFPESVQAIISDPDEEWPTTLRVDDGGSQVSIYLTNDLRTALIEALQNPEKEEDV